MTPHLVAGLTVGQTVGLITITAIATLAIYTASTTPTRGSQWDHLDDQDGPRP